MGLLNDLIKTAGNTIKLPVSVAQDILDTDTVYTENNLANLSDNIDSVVDDVSDILDEW